MIKYIRLSILLLLFTGIVLQSCRKNITDMTPSYISIDSISLTTNTFQGTSSHMITDAWVYINDDIQGIYELPATFPILAEGATDITIRAGIKINGISSTRMFYPFFQPISYNINLVKDSIVKLTPGTTYHPAVTFDWIENFEDGGISLERTNKSQVDIVKTSDLSEVFEGNYSGKVMLDSGKVMFESHTISNYVLNGNAINFLEINYKNNHELYVGVFALFDNQSVQRSVLVLNKSDVWKKVYVNLTNAVTENITANEFKIFFGMINDSTLTYVPTAYFDNIKLVHY